MPGAVEARQTRYARSGDVHIAYQVVGDGPLDLVWIPSATHHVELSWDNPVVARFLHPLSELGRLMVFDKRGTGMSDRVHGETLETRMDDIRAVMDDAVSERAVILGLGDGGPLAMLFAATYPERTAGLVLINTTPRFVRTAEFPWLRTRAEMERLIAAALPRWGDPALHEENLRRGSPDMSDDDVRAFSRVLRLSVSPGAWRDYTLMNLDVDVCSVLPSIRVPTLVVHRSELAAGLDVRGGRYIAGHIPGARLVEVPGRNFAPAVGDQEPILTEIRRFLAELESGEWQAGEPDRVLATVLFTDIVNATELVTKLGDSGWGELLTKHHELVRRELARHRGAEVDTAGDGFFASFDGPARAIRCACTVTAALRELGLEVRAGLHTGECELVDGKVGGIAVHIGARVASHAGPGEVLVSSTVKDLVAGSGIVFADRGLAELKGIPGDWRLFAVESAS